MLLPALVFGAKVEGPRVLEICRQHDSFVTGLPRKLNAQVPGIESHKGEFGVLVYQVLLSKRIKAVDRITECPSCANMFPGERRQACCGIFSRRTEEQRRIGRSVVGGGDSLHNGVIGVLTGLTRMLSR